MSYDVERVRDYLEPWLEDEDVYQNVCNCAGPDSCKKCKGEE